jgi:hypothetical protein
LDLTATVLIATIILVACEKSQVSNVEFSAMEEQTLANPANPDNPYDYYGLMHNEYVRKVLDEMPDLSNVSIDERLSVLNSTIQNVLLKDGFMMTKSTNLEDGEELMAAILSLIGDAENSYANFIDTLNFDSETKQQLQILFNDVISMSENKNLTVDDVLDAVIEFENKVLNNVITIPANDREAFLGSTSTLRHSLAFWYDEMDMDEGNGDDEMELRGNWWRWAIVGAADAAGYFYGGGGWEGAALGANFSLIAYAILFKIIPALS